MGERKEENRKGKKEGAKERGMKRSKRSSWGEARKGEKKSPRALFAL